MTVDEAIQKKDEFIRYALNDGIPVSRWARLLVKQYLADIKEAEENPDFPYYFDEEAAIHNYKIFSNLQFSEGNWRGKPSRFPRLSGYKRTALQICWQSVSGSGLTY